MVNQINNPDNSMYQEIHLFELVSALCFTTNKNMWEKDNKDYQLFMAIKSGAMSLDLSDMKVSLNFTKFLVGLLIFSIYIYENIGKKYVNVVKKQSSSAINVMFFDGESFTFDVHKFDNNMLQFFKKSLRLLFSKDNMMFNRELLVQLSKMYDAASQRLSKEVKFLQEIIKINDMTERLCTKNKFNINVLSIIFASMPQNFLNSFFMLAGNEMKQDFEIQTANGINVNTKAFFAHDTIDILELFNKIKFLIILYQSNQDLFFSLMTNKEIIDYLRLVFSDTKVSDNIRENIKETVEGQYLPRIKTIEAFQNIF
ncbi:MAG: hypothetical protein DKM50_04610 [Candidatus Margulisiibacteriota bacterium]|nr:MAG: hypothetical protein A2X41_06595 [Candidatus Margulisbacteria bacterium GWE2_39_32]PZM82033.1 MAG: hypothetical protein DKM50_04610 [Candidatus Margulisiibacteriota bacterium]HCY35846.1 hypothetical protein [Candidatus Margulisiibacteriota bacterium]